MMSNILRSVLIAIKSIALRVNIWAHSWVHSYDDQDLAFLLRKRSYYSRSTLLSSLSMISMIRMLALTAYYWLVPDVLRLPLGRRTSLSRSRFTCSWALGLSGLAFRLQSLQPKRLRAW